MKYFRSAVSFLFGVLCIFEVTAYGVPVPSPLFGNHALLQRSIPVPIWGTAEPGETLTVTFGKISDTTTTDESGHWRVQLPAMEGGKTGDLIFKGSKGSVTSSDVLTGDVWLCAGQSNIEFPLSRAASAPEEIAAAQLPNIRQFKVVPFSSLTPSKELKGNWVVCSPQRAGEFTAVGYYMARELYKQNSVPQGLINCTRGGTDIESWLSQAALQSRPEFQVVFDRDKKVAAEYPAKKEAYDKAIAAWNERTQKATPSGIPLTEKRPLPPLGAADDKNRATSCFNGMVYPITPTGIRGIVWYQGENNWAHPDEYQGYLQALIQDWRSCWNRSDLPFLVVQLPNYKGNSSALDIHWAELREAQAAALSLPHTGLVVTMDVGDPKEIHYTNKKPVGERLALVARRVVFGETVVDSGPAFVSARQEGHGMRVTFDDKGSPLVLRPPSLECRSFELAGADRKFYSADAELKGKDVFVSCPEVPDPVALRYCWRFNPAPVVFNQAGLPAAPFRTDQWVHEGKF